MRLNMSALAAIVTAGATGAVLLAAAPASADTNPWTITNTGAKVKFWAEGDVWRLYDTRSDSKAVHMYWEMPYDGLAGSGDNKKGHDTNVKLAKNVPDNHRIDICVWRTGDAAVCGTTHT